MNASRVDLRRLAHFLAVLDAGGVREAARRSRVAQPALSRSVGELEEDLGVRLFEREGRGLRPTDAAAEVAADARRVLADVDALVGRAHRLAGGAEGRLRLGTSPSASFHPQVPELLAKLRRERPGLRLELAERSTADLVEALLGREVDAAFVRPRATLPEPLDEVQVAQERILAVVPRHHPLAGKTEVDVGALLAEPLLLPAEGLGSGMSDVVASLAARHRRPLDVVARASHAASIVHLAAAGIGVGLVPESVRSMRTRGVAYVRVKTRERLRLVLASRSDAQSPALQAFLGMVGR